MHDTHGSERAPSEVRRCLPEVAECHHRPVATCCELVLQAMGCLHPRTAILLKPTFPETCRRAAPDSATLMRTGLNAKVPPSISKMSSLSLGVPRYLAATNSVETSIYHVLSAGCWWERAASKQLKALIQTAVPYSYGGSEAATLQALVTFHEFLQDFKLHSLSVTFCRKLDFESRDSDHRSDPRIMSKGAANLHALPHAGPIDRLTTLSAPELSKAPHRLT